MVRKYVFGLSAMVISLGVTIMCFKVWSNFSLTENDRLENVILIATCAIQTIATLFILQNNIIARNAYLRALEPSLLLKIKYAEGYQTIIKYKNTTDNPFQDLQIRCELLIDNRIIPCKDIFPEKLYLGPQESCKKSLYIMQYFTGQSVTFNDLLDRLQMRISFTYTFQGNRREYHIQDHKLVNNALTHAEWVVV